MITFRANKGSALTYEEMDTNLGSFFYSSSLDLTTSTLKLFFSGSSLVPIEKPPHIVPIVVPPTEMANNLIFGVGSVFYKAEKAVYDPSQNRLGVNVTAPTHTLHVSGSTLLAGSTTVGGGITNNHLVVGKVGVNTSTLTYELEVSGSIRASGNVIAYSDRRIKENIEPIQDALEKIETLSGFTYNKLYTPSRREAGVIAQEVEKVLPESIFTDNQGMLGVDYNGLTGLLIEAVKTLSQQVKELQEKIK